MARAFPLYNRKTSATSLATLESSRHGEENPAAEQKTINVEFISANKTEVVCLLWFKYVGILLQRNVKLCL